MATSDVTLCTNLCGKTAELRCSLCKTVYCSEMCQRQDRKFHVKYCGKLAYTYELTLLGSSDPVITRVFDVPAWFTFQQLHYTLQYAMGPWQCSHLHEFSFIKPSERSPNFVTSRNEVLRIGPTLLYDEEDDLMGAPSCVPKETEDSLLLSDAYDPAGRLRNTIAPDGVVLPLVYLYDFGDCWEHELIFRGSSLARAARPLFSAAQGCGPVEDCHGPDGWNGIKKAFRSPNGGNQELINWARGVSGLDERFDPFTEPDVKVMNYEGRWENHIRTAHTIQVIQLRKSCFMSLAKQGYEAYSESQSNVSKTGGQEYNSPHHSHQDGGQGGQDRPYVDHDEAVRHAANHGSGDSSLFSSALSHLNKNQSQHNDPVDEEEVQQSHRQAYHEGGAAGLSAGSMGGAAAMQVLKQFTSGGGSGGGGSTQLVSMAMAEASKLFDSSGGASSGSKQDAVNGAAMTVMKLMVQSKVSGMMGGGNSGGMGSLMGLASKFM